MAPKDATAERGLRILKMVARSDLERARLVRAGLPTALIDALVRRLGFSAAEVERLIIPRRTLAHRKQKRQPLSPGESDRLARVVRVVAKADETFQDAAKARTWLRRPNRALRGQPPIDLLDTDGGVCAVEAVLDRIAHGVFS